jgi:hypothetical protein
MVRRPSAERTFPEARAESVIAEEVDGEVLIYDVERDEAHCLGDTAALVWKHCDGRTSVASLAKLLPDHVGDGSRERLVVDAIEQLSERNLLAKPVAVPANGDGRSRRDFIVRVGGAGAAAAVGGSLITSIVVAPPSAHASHLASCAACTVGGHPCATGFICCPAGSAGNHPGKCGKVNGSSCTSGSQCCGGRCTDNVCASSGSGNTACP